MRNGNYTHKWFTIIEIMLVLTIIGILSLSLFPSIQWYLYRWRDTDRVSDIKNISALINLYYLDFDSYPYVTPSCSFQSALSDYTKQFPLDPQQSRNHGCGFNGNYGYGTWLIDNKNQYALSAVLEWPLSGHWVATGATNPFTGSLDSTDIINLFGNLSKWSGPLYVIAQ